MFFSRVVIAIAVTTLFIDRALFTEHLRLVIVLVNTIVLIMHVGSLFRHGIYFFMNWIYIAYSF